MGTDRGKQGFGPDFLLLSLDFHERLEEWTLQPVGRALQYAQFVSIHCLQALGLGDNVLENWQRPEHFWKSPTKRNKQSRVHLFRQTLTSKPLWFVGNYNRPRNISFRSSQTKKTRQFTFLRQRHGQLVQGVWLGGRESGRFLTVSCLRLPCAFWCFAIDVLLVFGMFEHCE